VVGSEQVCPGPARRFARLGGPALYRAITSILDRGIRL
jgi:hypothetical protein